MGTRVRFQSDYASSDCFYRSGQVVQVGTEWSEDVIPAEVAAGLLEAGVVVPAPDEPIGVESLGVDDDLMETAIAPEAETAARRPRRTKGHGK